jgi:hypothetical protein
VFSTVGSTSAGCDGVDRADADGEGESNCGADFDACCVNGSCGERFANENPATAAALSSTTPTAGIGCRPTTLHTDRAATGCAPPRLDFDADFRRLDMIQ